MKPRTLHATKILAVALAAAGCAQSAPGPKASADPIRAEAAPPPSVTAGAAVAPPPATASAAMPERPLSKDPALEALASQLVATPREAALAEVRRFRPLCDEDGYPRVGNVNTKGAGFEPSSFCAEIRARKAAR